MKKLFFILLIVSGLIALELVFPRGQWEDQVQSFLRNNVSKVMNWVNINSLV
jgi:hypothetical protein